ncbi:MAG TPA: heavy metal translocating P-type ATPase [Steroidobacteraceae bacterium]|nr:heavy metal translocating P-type ATPase [Steroidobacteraceae bacterium]HNS27334.1 heavy metal translocating P-type ATPase [Steroidobacteraceae bacterium]
MNAAARGCWHCGEPLPDTDAPQARVAGQLHPVCCHGCRAAAEWIDQLGLADYYRLRSAPAPRAASADDMPSNQAWSRPALERHVVRDLAGGRSEAVVLIEGLRCAACVWLIERALAALPGLVTVQVNATARRARIVWERERGSLAAILDTLERTGYRPLPLDAAALDDVRQREQRTALKQLVVAGFGAMQAMMYASGLYFGAFEGIDPAARELLRWLGLLACTPVVFYSARPFFAGAVRTLRARRLGVDVPVAIAIALIYAASIYEAYRGTGEVYFDSVSMFVLFLLFGRYLEMRARHRAGDLTDALARLTPTYADRIDASGKLERIGAIELVRGDRVHVDTGSGIPADGVLESARCRVDESLVSGESAAVARQRGEPLVAGSMLLDGPIVMRVERVGADTVLSGIVALVTRAATERPRLAAAGERAAAGFVARVLTLAALTATIWSLVDPSRAFTATLAVLVVSCPCAFALAVPAAITRSLGVLARRGVLVVRPDAIENLARATHIVFDKTGTLTEPTLRLESIEAHAGIDRDAALRLAAALARGSRHPVARAIAAGVAADIDLPEVRAQRTEAGGGLEGIVDGRRLRLGRADFALAREAAPELADAVVLAVDEGPIAAFRLAERLRPDARAAIDALVAAGLTAEIASGDGDTKVAAVAHRLGIAQWRARQRPDEKLARLAELRAAGARVAAVGDGINDAPVLAGADVSIALAGGAELAQATSDIVLSGGRLGMLPQARVIARSTLRILRQNQRWAMIYNLSVVPLGALGFIPPWLAAIGMSMSSLVVVLNALRIGREPASRAVAAIAPVPAAT